MNFDKLAEEIIGPIGGIFYFVPTNRKMTEWKLVGEKEKFGQDINHGELWDKKVIPELEKLITLTPLQKSALKNYSFSLPRGRVILGTDPILESRFSRIKKFWFRDKPVIILHGNNLPGSGLEVIRFFNLGDNEIEWKHWDHEETDPQQRKIIEKMLKNGPVK